MAYWRRCGASAGRAARLWRKLRCQQTPLADYCRSCLAAEQAHYRAQRHAVYQQRRETFVDSSAAVAVDVISQNAFRFG